MPSTYTHYRFGNTVLDALPDDLRDIVKEYRGLYDIGTHGPDIFFYHQPFHNDNINVVGHRMHKETAAKFFNKVKANFVKEDKYQNAMLAYLLGFCSHYCLDLSDHSYIEAKIQKSKVSHTLIEVEYDRYLLVKDGIDPFKKDMAEHLHATKENAIVIQKCFDEFKVEEVKSSIKQMIFYVRKLNMKDGFMRNNIFKVMKKMGIYDSFHEQFIGLKPSSKCMDSNLRLDKLEKEAYALFKELALNLKAFLYNEEELDKRFEHTFSYQDGFENIPVLNFEEEKKYEI